MVRYTGYVDNVTGEPFKDTAPVTFFTMPYLDVGPLEPEGMEGGSPASRPLLQNFHGYRVSTARDRNQVVQKLPNVAEGQALRVSQLWCLVIGPGK